MGALSRLSLLAPIFLLLLCFTEPAFAMRKFVHWFGRSRQEFEATSRNTCNVTLGIYEAEYTRLGGAAWIDLGLGDGPIYQYCRAHMSCILDNTDAAAQASLTAAGVILGLLPTLLAVLSPSIAELALLSVHRPILSFLASVGSPGVLQTRIFEYEDPAETLDLPDTEHNVTRLALALGPWSSTLATAISIFQYAVVLASGVNILYLAVQLGRSSVCSWGCTRSWPPILWAAFPFVIHLIAAYGYRLTLDPSRQSINRPKMLQQQTRQDSFFTEVTSPSGITRYTVSSTTPNDDKTQSAATTTIPLTTLTPTDTSYFPPIRSLPRQPRLLTAIKREFLPCAAHPDTVINNRLPLSHPSTRAKVGILLNCIAGFLSCMHLLYGTVVFASLNFIDTMDAIKEIAMRLLVSSVLCRLVVLVEIAGMRGARMQMAADARARAVAAGVVVSPQVGGGGQGWGGRVVQRRKENGRMGLR